MHEIVRRISRLAAALIFTLVGAGPGVASAQPRNPPAVTQQLAPLAVDSARQEASWAATLERIAASVVSIEIDQTRAFDTEWNSSSQATGFVVDAERGIILTNRHVVTPGPVVAVATFLNREEVQLFPLYRDPVHDFGFYRYDPSKLRFIRPAALPLFPEGAQIGREIRVVGNNAGEQLSILQGTLAKLDRAAPEYGIGRYNDFNTFYLQAASGTSGGSSGSPVIDIQGRVVALNAGGAQNAASSFYLPLGRVKRALELLQRGERVSRGTLQAVFEYSPFDELRRLGLDGTTEADVRRAFPRHTGMLVVAEVQPGSPSDGELQPGDILIRVNGRFVTQFEPLAEVLDTSVGGKVELELSRGGQAVTASVPVTDLHAITPDRYLEIGDAIVHSLSYQQARHFNIPVRGAYVANPGYFLASAGIPTRAVIIGAEGQEITGLDDFVAAMSRAGDGERVALRYSTLDDPNGSRLASVRVDRRWFAARTCQRNDGSGYWDCTDLPAAPLAKVQQPASTTFGRHSDTRAQRLAPSLVGVGFDMPYSVSGITEKNYFGTGLVVDAARGLVVVDRNTVPVSMGDVRLLFAGTLEIPGQVEYIHPLHNLAVVSYDPALIGSTPVRSARLSAREFRPGENVWVVGLARDGEMRVRATQIGDIEPLQLPLSRTMRFRDTNLDVASLATSAGVDDGVLADRNGDVVGLWSSFAFEGGGRDREVQQTSRGVAIELVQDMLSRLQGGRPLHSLDAEFTTLPVANARRLGLTQDWIDRIAAASPNERQVLSITRLVGGSDAQRVLRQGDLVLAVDGQVMTRFRDVERAVADRPQVTVTVWRDRAPQDVQVSTAVLTGRDFDRVLLWAGATLQAPHRAMLAQRGMPPTGVYVSYYAFGSPATRFGLVPGRRIVEVDGVPTPDLDAFLRAVTGKPDRSSVRLRTITWNNAPEVITLQLDKHYWPAYELRRNGDGWTRREIE